MQRTVHGTKVTYAIAELNADNQIVVKTETATIAEKDAEKATKRFYKEVGKYQILKTETFDKLYYIPDEVFFKYAEEITEPVEE